MKVQRVRVPETGLSAWDVLNDDGLPVGPVLDFLVDLNNLERSPNTVRSYAHHLKLFWEYLREFRIEWTAVQLAGMAEFVKWLRLSKVEGAAAGSELSLVRRETTVNAILAGVSAFYDYQEHLGRIAPFGIYQTRNTPRRPYKSFLHHIGVNKPYRARLIKLREPKRMPRLLTAEQVQALVRACRRIRDRLLICLLHETGMRIGQALGLRHEDIRSYDSEILLQPRINANGARGKSRHPYVVHVSKQLMELYADYLVQEYKEDGGDYVFVNRWGGERGRPMTYAAVVDLFRRIGDHTGVRARPHLFRHSHATDLIRSGMGMAYVQKRLGHAQIQTTINTYAHLADDDLKQAFDAYLAAKKAGPN